MSDQVEIVAAEDAPSNTQDGETVEAVQSTAEEPKAAKGRSAAKNASAKESEVEPLVDGPVGEVLDEGNEKARAQTEAPAALEVETPQPPTAEVDARAEDVQAAEAGVEELVDGPVGEVLDAGNVDARAETEVSTADEASLEGEAATEAKSESKPSSGRGRSSSRRSEDSEASKANVRMLSVGQQVQGTVKRIADFGAFVDIGVGRDGLIHISELSVRRVGKVTDVLSEGQEVTAWIKKLDRDRNRISLTLIDPGTKTIRDLNKDDLVQGTVTRILPYGAFVDIGIGRDALLHVREMGVGYVAKPEDVVKVGDTIEARIIELSRRRGRVDLSLKGLRDEPEPVPAPQVEAAPAQAQSSNSRRQAEPEPEPEEEDDYEDLEVLSPMELAFKRAMEAEGMEMPISRKKQGKRNRREGNRSLQDEIIARTLSTGRK